MKFSVRSTTKHEHFHPNTTTYRIALFPTEHLSILESQNPTIGVSEMHKMRLLVDFEAPYLRQFKSVKINYICQWIIPFNYA